MARSLTAPELARLRADGQRTKVYLAVLSPTVLIERRLNGAPAANDEVIEITYDDPDAKGGDPTTAVPNHCTMYISATGYGQYEKGMVRIRRTPGAATFYIGETSEIEWVDNDYLTIVREFVPWPRHNYIDGSSVSYMDRDLAFDDPALNPHAYPKPVPIMGPNAYEWLDLGTKGTVDILWDAGPAYSILHTGSASAYSWSVSPSGGTSWDNAAIAAPTLTITAAGTYTVALTITWDYGGGNTVDSTSHRVVQVYDDNNPPTTSFVLSRCMGSKDQGGWAFTVTLFDEALRSEIRDRALCTIFARDWYGTTSDDEGGIGPYQADSVQARENILASGWILGESIVWNPERGAVTFEVKDPRTWLSVIGGFPSGIEDYAGTPTDWVEFEDLTPGKGLWHFIEWRTTLPVFTDCYIYPDHELDGTELSEGLGGPPGARQISVFDAPPGNLWGQISGEAYRTIRATPLFDHYSRLFIQRDENEIATADRTEGNVPTVMTILEQDWRDAISLRRVVTTPISLIDLSGVAYKDAAADALFALSPGHIWKTYGNPERVDRVALWYHASQQTLINSLAGLIFGKLTNEYPDIPVSLGGNYRVFDITPWQRAKITIDAADTVRGIDLGEIEMYPRQISYRHDQNRGVLLADVSFEAESGAKAGITGDPPPAPPPPPSPIPPPPPPPIIPTADVDLGGVLLGVSQIGLTFDLDSVSPTWYDGDPDSDLSGTLYNVAVRNSKAYATTSDGLYYCANVLAAIGGSISWSEVKSHTDAMAETAYVGAGEFRSIDLDNSGNFCAPFHGNRGGAGAEYRGDCYLGQDGSADFRVGFPPGLVDGPGIGERHLHVPTTSQYQHVMWWDGGSFRVGAGKGGTTGEPTVCTATTVEITADIEYSDETKFRFLSAIYKGYVMSYIGEPEVDSRVFYGAGAFDLTPYTGLSINREVVSMVGMDYHSGGGMLNIYDDTNYDLYLDEAKIGDSLNEFGISQGGMAQFILGGDEDDIIWCCAAARSGANPTVLVTDDGGTTWVDKTTNLYAAIGNWAGGGDERGVIKTFEI